MVKSISRRSKIFEKITNTINKSLDFLCECERERDIQDILAIQLDCKSRQKFSSSELPDVEIDLMGDNFTIEVKYNEKYYSGISQILSQRILYNFHNNYLLHVHEYLNKPFKNAFTKLAQELDFIGILIDKRNKEIKVVK